MSPPSIHRGDTSMFTGFADTFVRCVDAIDIFQGSVEKKAKYRPIKGFLAYFHESEQLQAAIRDNMQKLGFALPEVGGMSRKSQSHVCRRLTRA